MQQETQQNNQSILKVKPFQETLGKGNCGPASLKMVLDYYGIRKTEDELVKLLKADEKLGTNDKSLEKVAKFFGFNVDIKNHSSLEDIRGWLNKDVPVIVDWFTRGRQDYSDSAVPDGHYSVVIDLDDKYIYLQDPEIGKIRKIEKNDFLTVWFDFTGEYIKPDELIIRQLIAIYK